LLNQREELIEAFLMRVHASMDGCTKKKEEDIFDLIKQKSESYRREFKVHGDLDAGMLEFETLRLERLNRRCCS
jgi:hypothetical protein